MDIYEARRLVLMHVLKHRYNEKRADLARDAKVSPSYLTRLLQAPDEGKAIKRIDTDMAQKLEQNLKLADGVLLNPVVERDPLALGGSSKTELPSRKTHSQTIGRRLKVSEIVKAHGDGVVENLPQPEGTDLGSLDVLQQHEGHIVLKVRGDGLAPLVKNGAHILVAPGDPCVLGEDVLIQLRDGTRLVKTLWLDREDSIAVSNLADTKQVTIDKASVASMQRVVAYYPASMWQASAEESKAPVVAASTGEGLKQTLKALKPPVEKQLISKRKLAAKTTKGRAR